MIPKFPTTHSLMYYLVYGILYLLSLLPWWIIYLLSDLIYFLLYYVSGYRKKIVAANLLTAFPEKSDAERQAIGKQFYKNFVDNFLESLKLLSISKKNLLKRISSNIEVINDQLGKVPSITLMSGHFFNWEYGNYLVALKSQFTYLGVYMPIKNKAFNKIMYDLRKKFGTILLPATGFKPAFLEYADDSYILGLLADQNPGDPKNAYWVPFFGQLTPFVKGPERTAIVNNSAVVFTEFKKVKRGYYHLEFKLVTTDPKSFAPGGLTKELIRYTEDAVRSNPSLYLWSHRRWKWKYNEEEFGDLVVK